MTKPIDIGSLVLKYNASNSRLLFLDYDRTLIQFGETARDEKWDTGISEVLRNASMDKKNQVILISGKDRQYLDDAFGSLPVVLVAEHGAFYKEPQGTWNKMFLVSNEWINKVLPAFKALAFQYEGSFLEIKTFSLAWHYHGITDKVTEGDKRQILAAIRSLPMHNYFQIYDGEFSIELRTPKINKGFFAAQWMGTRKFDLVLAIGDGQADEDLFRILGPKAYTITIGQSYNSSAMFHLNSAMDVSPFIQSLLCTNEDFERMRSRIGLEQY